MGGRLTALATLTTRGRSFLASGIAAGLCAFALGQKDLLRVAIFLCALPLVTALVVSGTRYRISATRFVEPLRVPVGGQSTIRLRLENVGRMPTGLLLLEDKVPYVLGARPRFVLDRMSSRWRRDLTYQVRPSVRGKFTIGPVTLRVTDPFGLVELSRPFQATDALLVTPEVHPLPYVRMSGEWAANGESRPRAAAADGQEDVTVREYRHGDPLRRVHWRTSARRGELMVRREEQPWQSRATLFLDTRRIGHRGSGPASSFEWAVSATASMAVHLLRRDYSIGLTTDTGASVTTRTREASAGGDAEAILLDALTGIGQSSTGHLGQAKPALPNDGTYGLLIAVVGAMTPAEAEALVRLRQRASNALAIVVDSPSWALGKERTPERLATELAESSQIMQRAGWHVVRAGAGDHIAEIWTTLLLANQGAVSGSGPLPSTPAAARATTEGRP